MQNWNRSVVSSGFEVGVDETRTKIHSPMSREVHGGKRGIAKSINPAKFVAKPDSIKGNQRIVPNDSVS